MYLSRLVSVFSLCAAILSGAQALAQIPNNGFETWVDDCTLGNWFINSQCGLLTPITKTTDAHSGLFAARGEVIQFLGQTVQPIIQSGDDANGFPISERYTTVQAHYRFTSVGGDRFSLNVVFYKGESAVIAQGAAVFPATTGTAYVPCSVTMNYVSAETPDRAIIQASIVGPVTGSDFHVGSVMYFDDVTFGAVAGAEPRLTIALSGNSATVSWPTNVTGYTLQQTTSLSPINWSNVPGLTAADRVHTFLATSRSYFRLFKP